MLRFDTSALVVSLCFFVHLAYRYRRRRHLPLPPGPTRWPIIGNTLIIPLTNVHKFYKNLGQKLGWFLYVHTHPFSFVYRVKNDLSWSTWTIHRCYQWHHRGPRLAWQAFNDLFQSVSLIDHHHDKLINHYRKALIFLCSQTCEWPRFSYECVSWHGFFVQVSATELSLHSCPMEMTGERTVVYSLNTFPRKIFLVFRKNPLNSSAKVYYATSSNIPKISIITFESAYILHKMKPSVNFH